LARLDFSPDLAQMLPRPPRRDATFALLQAVDFVVATGSQANVRAAHTCGTPAVGVGVGNAPVIIDETADLRAAARLICRSKTFDNATSCSSENSVVIAAAVYDSAVAALAAEGGVMLAPAQKAALQKNLWSAEGKLNRDLIARDFSALAAAAGLPQKQAGKFLLVAEDGVGAEFPFSGEKMSLALAVYRAADFDEAARICGDILRYQGCGHSVGIHTQTTERPLQLGLSLPVCRVIVNQAHCFATGGGFDNGLPFSLSMGCGAWGGNNISGNLTFRHFLNTTVVARPISGSEPAEDDIFADYFSALAAANR
jgi:sulfoacetaldehyde dehydrogenase